MPGSESAIKVGIDGVQAHAVRVGLDAPPHDGHGTDGSAGSEPADALRGTRGATGVEGCHAGIDFHIVVRVTAAPDDVPISREEAQHLVVVIAGDQRVAAV